MTPYASGALIDDIAERRETYQRFWKGELGRPIVSIQARREEARFEVADRIVPETSEDLYLNPDFVIPARRAYLARTEFLGDSIPHVSAELGPGAMASYLGSETVCDATTVWYRPAFDSLDEVRIAVDEDNYYWRKHFQVISSLAEAMAEYGTYVTLPDLIEGLDVLASLRGNEDLVLDLMDDRNRDAIHEYLRRLTDCYLHYYDAIRARVADDEDWSICVFLETYGQGRTCKIQCDFAALMDPVLFREFAMPCFDHHSRQFDFVNYHLDGPDAVYSTPLLCDIENIHVIQWIPGAGNLPEYDPAWDDDVFDVVAGAGKTIQLVLNPRSLRSPIRQREHLIEIIAGLDRLVAKYGPDRFWLVFKYGFQESLVRELLLPACRDWGCDFR